MESKRDTLVELVCWVIIIGMVIISLVYGTWD